jgi:hypothetical protein
VRYLREKMATWVEASRVSVPPVPPSTSAPYRPNEGDWVEVAFKGDDGVVDGWWEGQVAKIKGDFAYVSFPQQVFLCACSCAFGRGGTCVCSHVCTHMPPYASPAHAYISICLPCTRIRLKHTHRHTDTHTHTHTHTHTRGGNQLQDVVELAALRPAQGHAPGISLIPLYSRLIFLLYVCFITDHAPTHTNTHTHTHTHTHTKDACAHTPDTQTHTHSHNET